LTTGRLVTDVQCTANLKIIFSTGVECFLYSIVSVEMYRVVSLRRMYTHKAEVIFFNSQDDTWHQQIL